MTPSDPNPYAPPAVVDLPPSLDSGLSYFSDGDFLVVRDGAELPPVCLRTNEPSGENGWRKRVTIAWTPPWVFITILLNILVLLIVMAITQKKAKITYSLSAATRAKIVKVRGIGFALLMAAIGSWIMGFSRSESISGVVMMFVGAASLIASLVMFGIANPVKVVKFRDGWFRIKGCSKEFLATLPVQASPF